MASPKAPEAKRPDLPLHLVFVIFEMRFSIAVYFEGRVGMGSLLGRKPFSKPTANGEGVPGK